MFRLHRAYRHDWDEGHSVTSSTCTADGVIEYRCKNTGCKEKMIKAESATGHTPGQGSYCTEPQTCEKCSNGFRTSRKDTAIPKDSCSSAQLWAIQNTNAITATSSYIGDYTDKGRTRICKNITAPTCTGTRLHNKYLRKLR